MMYCWRDGVIGMGRTLPQGALEIARGGTAALRAFRERVTVWEAQRETHRIPGMTKAMDPGLALRVLRARVSGFSMQVESVSVNQALDLRFIGDD